MNKINDFLNVMENQTISAEKTILATDLNGNSKPVIKCNCCIVAFESMSINRELIDEPIYLKYKAEIDAQVQAFKDEMLVLAEQNGVPVM